MGRKSWFICGLAVMVAILSANVSMTAINMDLNKDGRVGIEDAILGLQIQAGLRSGQVTLSNVIQSLQIAAGMNPLMATGYTGTEASFNLIRSGANQFLLPVEVGNQTLNLLVDTGSNALLVFEDKLGLPLTGIGRSLSPNLLNPIQVTETGVSKSYSSAVRSGVLATAPVRIGAYYAPAMRIMIVQSPDSRNDPSLTEKGADGIIGLRRTEGLTFSIDNVPLDAPLGVLQPPVSRFELDLPPTGQATLSFGNMPILDYAKSLNVFKAKTLSVQDPANPIYLSYSDLQVPFSAKSRYGEANSYNFKDLDVLLDTGAVSKLVLDTEVAKALGYNPATESWSIPEDSEIEFNLVGPKESLPIYPKFKVSEISVAPYKEMGVTFEAVLGIDRWQHYVIGFAFVDYQSGGPDGTMLMLARSGMAESHQDKLPDPVLNYQSLAGLNSLGDERYPSSDYTGDTVVFQSNRPGGLGGLDIYVWKKYEGILNLPGLNTDHDEGDPSITGDGRYIVFHSDRPGGTGNFDIYMYDLVGEMFIPLPGLNSYALDRNPCISTDGRYIAFRSERTGQSAIYLYDRNTSDLVSLPGLESVDNDYDPSLNQDGSLIAFERDFQDKSSAIYVYDVANHKLEFIPNSINGMAPAISPDGTRVAFQTTNLSSGMGLYDRNFMIFNRQISKLEMFSGLNTEFDEAGITFTGDGKSLLLYSERPGGEAGSNIYFYNSEYTISSVGNLTTQNLPEEDINLNRVAGAEVYTLTATTGFGQKLTLLLDTSLEGIILFKDKAPGGSCIGPEVSLYLLGGVLNAPEQTCIPMKIGNYIAGNGVIPLINSQEEYNALTGRADLPTVDGVIGLRGAFANQFVPRISMLEFGFIEGEPMGMDLKPGLSIGKMPVVKLADGQGDFLFSVEITGVTDPDDPVHKSYTNMDIPFIARTDTGKTSPEGKRILLSTVIRDRLILDTLTAENLGYTSSTGWGDAKSVNIAFSNDKYVLPAGINYPVEKVEVADLSQLGCDAVLSGDRWMDTFLVGFDVYDYLNGGPYGDIHLLHVKDVLALKGKFYEPDRHFLSLPGLNSLADDISGDISDDGQIIVFGSNRPGGQGGYDIYVYKVGQGLLDLPNLNSFADDTDPTISANGRLVAFQSYRSGNADIFLYDIISKSYVELPGLNTEYDEGWPDISADGSMLAFYSTRPVEGHGLTDLYLYDIIGKKIVPLYGQWLNTNGNEYTPGLNKDGSLMSFGGSLRDDGKGLDDVFLYDLKANTRIELPDFVNTASWEADSSLSSDERFLAITSYTSDDQGNIYLLDLKSGKFVFLPGLNTPFEDSVPALSANAQYILFQSNRPGGQGGADIYVYQRDETDTTTYTVSDSYEQKGYVQGSDGNKVPLVEVKAYDKGGRLIGTATTDATGYFAMTIPLATQLPIRFETTSAGAEIVTDDVGDDTYVPDFTAGNMKFTRVWIEDKAQAGFPTTIRFDIESTTPTYNTYVKVYLKAGNPSGVVVNGSDFTPDYELTALVIGKLCQIGEVTEPVITTQGSMVTRITYRPGTGNCQANVEHTFIVPAGITDGLYTAVFGINTLDVSTEDDAIQGEIDKSDNFLVASASTIIGNPDKPNLRVLSAKLLSHSFELPASRPGITSVPENFELSLNMEVESMAQDTTLPVDIVFEMEIGGQRYPMTFAESNGQGGLKKAEKQTYGVQCRPEDRQGYPAGDRCASLFRQEQTGKTYNLYLNDAAYDALEPIIADTDCFLVITVDPGNKVAEYENNKTDNMMRMPVKFLAPPRFSQAPRLGAYANVSFDYKKSDVYGNEDFGVGYDIGPKLSYAQNTYNGVTYPYAVNFDGNNQIWAKIFGIRSTVLSAGAVLDVNGDSIVSSYFDYGVIILGTRIWGQRYGVPWYYQNKDEISLWDTKDDDGNEKYSKSEEKKWEKTFMVGSVPVTLAAGLTGEMGIRAEVKYLKPNKLQFEGGPYASLTGVGEASVGVSGFGVGLGCELLLIEIYLKLTPSVQILPSYPIAIIRFEAPIVLSTLDGKVYAFVRTFGWDSKVTIIEWKGYSYDIHFFKPLSLAYGATEQFKTFYYNNDSWSGTVNHVWEGLIWHDWGIGGPPGYNSDYFSVMWEGYFNFPGWEEYTWGDEGTEFTSKYTFYKDSDDGMTVWVDMNDNDSFEDSERIFNDHFGTGISEATSIKSGYHKVRVKYREGWGGAAAKLYWLKQNQFGAWYYNNKDLSGPPVYFDTTEKIDFDWKEGSPKDGFVNRDGFSVKWEGNFDFPAAASYIFWATGDDGIRVYVDDALVIDAWRDQGPTTYTTSKWLTAGSHKVTVTYYDNGWGAMAKVSWAPFGTLVGRYYNNTSFSGKPALVRNDGNLLIWENKWEQFLYGYWNQNISPSPAPGVVNQDNFTVRWEGAFWFNEGDYDFAAIRDDGMKLWVDDELVFSHWTPSIAKAELATKTMTAGYHRVRIDYVEYWGHAFAFLKWGPHRKNEFTATYIGHFDSGNDQTPKYINKVDRINYNWGYGRPDAWWTNFSGDQFTVVWEGDFDFEGSPYLFTAYADDWMKVWIDNTLIMTANCCNNQYREAVPMNQGTHHVKVEYREEGGAAVAKLGWEKISSGVFYAQKFENNSFSGDPTYYWAENKIDYDWGYGSPNGRSDDFSIRWEGVFYFDQDRIYLFAAEADDKIYLWVDGIQIIRGEGVGSYVGWKSLSRGFHSVKVEYVEYGGQAKAKLVWR